jgi:UDP-N-acetylmuramyl pentapeptide phosphotransferase/UDP-N-acetylglucosamine-1-phosphate transferase
VGLVVAVVAGLSICFALDYEWHDQLNYLLGAMLLIAVVSFMDDWITLPVVLRLLVHLGAAAVVVYSLGNIQMITLPFAAFELADTVAVIFTVLFVMWLVNLFNFMDGMDGLAAGMAIIGFGTDAILGMLNGAPLFMIINLVIVAASTGFLVFNFPPAGIFMGDTGSSVLGYLAAAMAVWADTRGLFPLWIAAVTFSPFIIDATITLSWRIWRRERFWEAHRSHYYQRLATAGWGHRRTLLWEYALMIVCGVSAILAFRFSEPIQILVLLLMGIIYTVSPLVVTRIERIHNTPDGGL